jgi:hypothetical protein
MCRELAGLPAAAVGEPAKDEISAKEREVDMSGSLTPSCNLNTTTVWPSKSNYSILLSQINCPAKLSRDALRSLVH